MRRQMAEDARQTLRRVQRIHDRQPQLPQEAADIVRSATSRGLTLQAAQQDVDALQAADLFWVSADMAAQCLDAASDVPELDAGRFICPNGLVIFAQPLPPLPTPELTLIGGRTWQGDLPVSGLWWHRTTHQQLSVSILARRDDLPGRISGDGLIQMVLEIIATRDQVRLDNPLLAQILGQQYVAVMSLLMAMNMLMQTPTVATRTLVDARTGRMVGERTRRDDQVTLVDLRPLRHEHADTDTAGRRLTHRFLVRGHWTHQPYGPSRALRKLIYIEPYVKGPDGVPLLTRDKVTVWRR